MHYDILQCIPMHYTLMNCNALNGNALLLFKLYLAILINFLKLWFTKKFIYDYLNQNICKYNMAMQWNALKCSIVLLFIM